MNSISRRKALITLGASALSAHSQQRMPAQDTLHILCGYPPRGSVDIVCRKLAEKLQGRVASRVVVENKPGAAGRLAVDELKRTKPGTALLVTPASVLTLYPHVYRALSYDPFRDLVTISTLATTGFALAVGPLVPSGVGALPDLVRWCREQGRPVSCGNAGAGSMPHLMGILMARELGVEIVHVPYRGGSAAMQGVASGDLPLAIGTEASALPLSQSGRVRVLATTWDTRSPVFPDVPGFAQSGWPSLGRREWFGAFVSAGAPAPLVDEVVGALRDWTADTDVVGVLQRAGLRAETSSATQLREMMAAEHAFWGPVVQASGFTPET